MELGTSRSILAGGVNGGEGGLQWDIYAQEEQQESPVDCPGLAPLGSVPSSGKEDPHLPMDKPLGLRPLPSIPTILCPCP